MAVEEAAPAQRVGPMRDPPLAEDPAHGSDRSLQEMIDARERTLALLWERRNQALDLSNQEELDAIEAQIDYFTML